MLWSQKTLKQEEKLTVLHFSVFLSWFVFFRVVVPGLLCKAGHSFFSSSTGFMMCLFVCPTDCIACSTVYVWSTDLKYQVEVIKSLGKDGSREQVASFPQVVFQASAYFLKIPALNWIYSSWSKVIMNRQNRQNRWFSASSHFVSKLWTDISYGIFHKTDQHLIWILGTIWGGGVIFPYFTDKKLKDYGKSSIKCGGSVSGKRPFYSPPPAKCCMLFWIASIHSIIPNAAEENGIFCPSSG